MPFFSYSLLTNREIGIYVTMPESKDSYGMYDLGGGRRGAVSGQSSQSGPNDQGSGSSSNSDNKTKGK